ncbi:HAD family hydrolase [Ideonella livida]|uniref:HAD family hydrolase n=1 Tax=Ideonella livida TaxID=2707176 RepID=A0A7C9PIF5_9BURK|nr:HAD family hydrolase [Ideonella livida]NDY91972.1 HAD family hydrolase [Ideonella livida]
MSALAGLRAVRALTLDLDDTLWPVWPAIDRAEVVLHDWLRTHAPATAAAFDGPPALRAVREQVGRDHPEHAHDLSWLRLESIRRALARAGDDPALAAPAFALFMDHRQRVDLYPDVPAALAALSARFPILALTNGNADLVRIGLGAHFVGSLGARDFGVGKPDPRFFAAACTRLGCAPQEVLHIGDDWRLDVEGARAAGLFTAWVRRPGHPDRPSDAAPADLEMGTLEALVQALDAVRAA